MALATDNSPTGPVVDNDAVRAKLVELHSALVGDPLDDLIMGDGEAAEMLVEELIEVFGGWREGERVVVELYDESKMPPSDVDGFMVGQVAKDGTIAAYTTRDMHWIESAKPSYTYPNRVDGSEYVWVEIWVPRSLTLRGLGETEPCAQWMVFEETHLGHRLHTPTKFDTKDEAIASAQAIVAGWDARDDVHGDRETADASAQRRFDASR